MRLCEIKKFLWWVTKDTHCYHSKIMSYLKEECKNAEENKHYEYGKFCCRCSFKKNY